MNSSRGRWRLAGVAVLVAGYAIPLVGPHIFAAGVQPALSVLVGMPLALAGTLLLIQGDRAVRAWRVECSRHRDLLFAIRARRSRRR